MTRLFPGSDDPAVIRFREDVLAIVPEGPARLGLAVSGGPDSLALLLLARAAFPDVAAATVDHGLRPAAAAEADFVHALCTDMGVPHQILTLGKAPDGNVSAWARTHRYQALQDWAEANDRDWLATAHHADDQLETILMRLNRGAGVAGLAGVRPRRGSIIRPLLTWRKTALEAVVCAAGITAVDDPSNRDDRFDRARMRSALTGIDWLDPQAAVRSAQALASAEEALDWSTSQEFSRRATSQPNDRLALDAQGLPYEFQRRLVLRCLTRFRPDSLPREEELARLISTLEAGRTATLAGVKCRGGTLWTFELAPPPRDISRNS